MSVRTRRSSPRHNRFPRWQTLLILMSMIDTDRATVARVRVENAFIECTDRIIGTVDLVILNDSNTVIMHDRKPDRANAPHVIFEVLPRAIGR